MQPTRPPRAQARAIRGFCAYGFLKNQRYFEPFLLLALTGEGLSFTLIGLAIGVREATTALLEVPSGAVADVWGRRRSLVLSFLAYIASFLLLGLATGPAADFPAMVLYGIGDTFRSGTHKAIIFAWLRQQGLQGQRTRVYGLTRSWSKLGSAAAVVLGAVLVLTTDGYRLVFLASTLPYVLGLLNFATYPAGLDRDGSAGEAPPRVASHLATALRAAWHERGLRGLLVESSALEGVHHAVKDYVQPALAATAAVLLARHAFGEHLGDAQRTALLVGPVFLVLHLASAVASRRAHGLVAWAGGEEPAARRIWSSNALAFLAILAGALAGWTSLVVLGFVALHVLQNLWRPLQMGRFDGFGPVGQGATLLSVESLLRRVTTMVLAPLVGLAVDAARSGGGDGLWPIGVLGLVVALAFSLRARGRTGAPGREELADGVA